VAQQKSPERSRVGAKKESADARPLSHPRQGAKARHMIDAPVCTGAPSVMPALKSKALRLRLAVCEKAEPTIARRSNCQCGWDSHRCDPG
jgi:hypothetical protein